jgi:nucleotide-binding universal stress UspA family protein
VLLADRGADDAAVARRAAADLAARAGVPVRLVTAWEVTPLAVVTPTTSDVDVWGLFEDSARAAQREVRHHLAALGSKVDAGYVAEGSTPAVVARTADMIDASVVVIGSRAGGGLRGHLLGLLPEAVVRSAHRPVLVVRGESAVWPPRAIIIGEGCSPGVPSVALDGARLARVLAVPAVLVRVIPHPGQTRFDESGEPSAASVREELRGRAARLQAESGAAISAWVTRGDPAEILLGLASDPRVLTVLGRRPQRHFGLGRAVSNLLHHAAGPVLIVPESASQSAPDSMEASSHLVPRSADIEDRSPRVVTAGTRLRTPNIT